MKQEYIDRAKEVAESLAMEYEIVGIRVQEVPFEEGEIAHRSHIWNDGNDTGEELSGVCAINASKAELAVGYYGDHVAIVAGNRYEYGEDVGEVIIDDAVVVEILA